MENNEIKENVNNFLNELFNPFRDKVNKKLDDLVLLNSRIIDNLINNKSCTGLINLFDNICAELREMFQ